MSDDAVDLSDRKASLAPGTMLDHYRLGECLGVGGMGEVYYAVHEILQTPCAVKIIRPEIAKGSPDVTERLIREARMACRIQHDNIVGVIDASSTSSLGCPYIVMEYVDGVTVEKYLESGPMPEGDVLTVALSVTEALIAAAKYKVVHRDIKPANIMIDTRGLVKLADLGIAKSDSSVPGVTLTRENAVLGTPNYAAPEQLRSSHNVDARADIYSLGASMYHMLSGHRPFEGDTVFNVIAKVACETPPKFKELGVKVSPALSELVERMMSKDPEQRPASAQELKELLQKAARGKRLSAFGSPRRLIKLPALLLSFFDKDARAIYIFLLAAIVAVPLFVGSFAVCLRNTAMRLVNGVQEKLPARQYSSLRLPLVPGKAEVEFDLSVRLPDGTRLTMTEIRAGSFMMGSPKNERGRGADEEQHRVTLTKSYWLGKYAVNNKQWRAVMGDSRFRSDDHPAAGVSWEDAKEFCEKLNERLADELPEGYRFDLPTEAQWEYACRAGTTTALNSDLDRFGRYDKNSGSSTSPAGKKVSNAWGLYDLHGNVAEWCRDWYGPYGGPVTDPVGPPAGLKRVVRGGSRGSFRSARRDWDAPDRRSSRIGFRLALVPVR